MDIETITRTINIINVVFIASYILGILSVFIYFASDIVTVLSKNRKKILSRTALNYASKHNDKEFCRNLLENFCIRMMKMFPNTKVYFSRFSHKSFDAQSALHRHSIGLNHEYAKHLCDNPNNNEICCMMALGHEFGHQLSRFNKSSGYKIKGNGKAQRIFKCYIEEVFCDTFSVIYICNGDGEKWVANKKPLYEGRKYYEKNANTHPSWVSRFRYVTEYSFDETLWRKIAEEAGYDITDADISDIREHYSYFLTNEHISKLKQ